jgi:hypothetical protein
MDDGNRRRVRVPRPNSAPRGGARRGEARRGEARPSPPRDNFLFGGPPTYDLAVVKRVSQRRGPGPAKAGPFRFIESRAVEVFRSADYRWRELLERADVMSEGAIRNDADGPSYYGTTSLLLPIASQGGVVPDELSGELARLVTHDVHARVRAIRIACREARVRSVHPIGRIRAELVVRADPRGIRIDVDVEARVVATTTRAAGGRAR